MTKVEHNLAIIRRNLMIVSVLFFFSFVLLAGDALAQVPGPGVPAPQPEGDVLTGLNIQQFLVQAVATAVGYAINYFGPQVSEQAKGVFMILFNAAVAAAYVAIAGGNFGFNMVTLVAIVQGIISAAIAHGIFKPTGIAFALGAGRNKPSQQTVFSRSVVGAP